MVTIHIIERCRQNVGDCKCIDLVARMDEVKEQSEKEIQGIFPPAIFVSPGALFVRQVLRSNTGA